jgi:hypothetical protein
MAGHHCRDREGHGKIAQGKKGGDRKEGTNHAQP